MTQLIECVPNFSEGNDLNIINQIKDTIVSVSGVKVLNVDPGKATNRTVITFIGSPQPVVDAAFLAIKKAAELIDMSKHHGEHPRMGATDVCPLIPISGITIEETSTYAHQLGKRVGQELHIPVYMYEASQSDKKRNNLSIIRSGEYEGFFKKIKQPEWKPDYGPVVHSIKAGSTVIGARDFLIAYNINLNTTSVKLANSIAYAVRESGRKKREGHPETGKIIKDSNGNPLIIPGTLKSVKAIGWYIKEYGIAQVSMNLTNINTSPVHVVFDEVSKKATEIGVRVTGSELIGLIPLKCMLDAGRYFLTKQQRSTGVSDDELVHIAVKSLGLDDLAPFDPQKRIIEYLLEDQNKKKLTHLSLREFADATAAENATPGGGSVAAYIGTLSASLGSMVANLSANKNGEEAQWQQFSVWAEKAQQLKKELLKKVDEDTLAFNSLMDAYRLPKKTDEEKQLRLNEIQKTAHKAAEVPFQVMQLCMDLIILFEEMINIIPPVLITDIGVGIMSANTAIKAAFLNVKINIPVLTDTLYTGKLIKEGSVIQEKASILEEKLLTIVYSKVPNYVNSKTNS